MAPNRYVTSNGTGGHVGSESDADDVDVRCGYGKCKPEALQKCNNPKILLLFLCIFVLTQGFVVNGLNNVNTQSIERRFQLPSSKSGLISSSYDFSAAIIGVFISFFGSGRNKYRWLVVGAISLGLGSLTMALPHFTTGLYEWGQNVAGDTCSNGTSTVDGKCTSGELQNYLGVLMFGMILHGVGGCIAYTVGVGFLDDSVSAETSPLYLGVFYGAAALGPGLGYIIGGQLLNFYVDFDKVDTSTIDLATDDPRWVGAWWAGFFVSVIISFLVAIPLSCFGAELPTAKRVREGRVSQMHKGSDAADERKGTGADRLSVRQFPKVTLQLLKNLPFVFTMLAGATEGILTSGFATFVPKYIQNHFSVSSGTAALYTGAAAVPGAAGGMFVGGLICSKLKLKVPGMFKFSIITCFITILFMNFLWLSCDEDNFAGVSTSYPNGTTSLVDTCNMDCHCNTRFFDPVCANGVQYFSACHAGCNSSSADGKTYTECACVAEDPAANVTMVTAGLCKSGCGMLYVFLVLLFFVIFITFLPSTPSDAATLRCIHADHRTFSMGLKWMFIRLLGTVPGPVIFGAVTDTACRVWQTECGEESSCWIYDNFAVSRNYFLLAMSAKALSMLFFSLAYCLYKPPPDHSAIDKMEVRDGAKKQMSFENGSFRASEYEGSVLGVSRRPEVDKTTNL